MAAVVEFLAEKGVIDDYSQVALLLHSVRVDHSGPYLEALDKVGTFQVIERVNESRATREITKAERDRSRR